MASDSRSDLEALRRSGRGKILALSILLIGALGAAGWFFFFEQHGIGAPERADKVLIVRGPRKGGYSAALQAVGFDAAEGQLKYWVEKAQTELEEPPEGTDVQQVMTLADHFGYGYVAFEDPQSVEFDDLDIASVPSMPPHVRFAVLSVGDFAFPHSMTVNPEPSRVLRRPGLDILQALFEQEVLAASLPDNDAASVAAIQLRSSLKDAIDDLGLVARAEGLAGDVERQVREALSDEQAANPPVLLAKIGENGRAVPGPGGILATTRSFSIVSRDAIRAELELAPSWTLWTSALEEGAPRSACSSLVEGELSTRESPRFEYSPDGSALVLATLTHGEQLWTVQAGSACAWSLLGSLSPSGLDEVHRVLPRGAQVARVGTMAGDVAVELLRPGTDEPPATTVYPGLALRDVAWLDATHLIATGDDDVLYVLSTIEGEKTVAIRPPGLGRDASLHEVARRSDTSVIITVGTSPRRLARLDAPTAWGASDQEGGPEGQPNDAADDHAADDDAQVQWASSEGFRTTILTRQGRASQPAISPDGSRVAYTVLDEALDDPGRGDDLEIAVVSVDGGAVTMLTRNVLRDHSPRWSHDGGSVVFETRVEMARSDWRITVPRAAFLTAP